MRQVQYVHRTGHVDVGENRSNIVPAFQNRDRLIGIASFPDSEPGGFHLLQRIQPNKRLILDDENNRPFHACVLLPTRRGEKPSVPKIENAQRALSVLACRLAGSRCPAMRAECTSYEKCQTRHTILRGCPRLNIEALWDVPQFVTTMSEKRRRQLKDEASADLKTKLIELIPHLRAFATALCRNRDLAEDLAQEALIKAWRAQSSFEPGRISRLG